jgi:TorA maturation chaperone TorD
MENIDIPKESIISEEILVGETLLFSLLGKLLYTLPERTWLETLYQDDIFSESPFAMNQPDVLRGLALLQQWAGYPAEINEAKMVELAADNTRLFIGIGTVLAPLWESVYFSKERLIFQECTLEVRNWYRRFNLVPETLYKEPDDHISLEMEFIAYLSTLARQAREAGDQMASESILEVQREFFSKHLLRWAFQWCQLVLQNAKTDFYRGLAYLVRGSVSELAIIFILSVPEERAG